MRLHLVRPVRHRLARLDRKTRDADLRIRCRVLLKVAEGRSLNAAARDLGCAPATAWRIVARFGLEGEASVMDGRRDNGQRKVSAEVVAGLRQILEGTPQDHGYPRPTWTLELVARVVEEQLQVTLSVGHLWRILRDLETRWGQPRPVVACPWPRGRRQRRIARLRQLARQLGPGEVVLYADEVDLHLNPRIGRDWMLKGQQRLIVTPGKNVKRYLAGAYDPVRKRLVYVQGDRKASWLFLNLLRALSDAYRQVRRVHVILDNFVIHKSRLVQAWLKSFGAKLRLHFLPPYCPQENKIERLWQDLHANVTRNHRCRTIVALMEAVHQYLDQRFVMRRVMALAA
jgi:transposase